jgi:hypothetical protein
VIEAQAKLQLSENKDIKKEIQEGISCIDTYCVNDLSGLCMTHSLK